MKKIIYMTHLQYPAKGRNYYEEDIYLTGELLKEFPMVLCPPSAIENFEDESDLIIIRNTGAIIYYLDEWQSFCKRAKEKNLKVYNPLELRGDMQGKNYLVHMTEKAMAVTPTVKNIENLERLPLCEKYVTKPIVGCDSIDLEILTRDELLEKSKLDKKYRDGSTIIQPFLDIQYECSFMFLDNEFQYAIYAPNKEKRWQLEVYRPDAHDLNWAKDFIKYEENPRGIVRVDGARLKDGSLALVELEDLNPYLSLDLLTPDLRENFVNNFKRSIRSQLASDI